MSGKEHVAQTLLSVPPLPAPPMSCAIALAHRAALRSFFCAQVLRPLKLD
jgi:hypothetical protein